jgi:membrane associated rhomboid family serine protease
VNETPDAAEGKAYRQSPDGPDVVDAPRGRGRRVVMMVVTLLGLAALAAAAYIVMKHRGWPRWQAPSLAAGGVVFALLGAVGMAGRRGSRSTYRFDSTSARALSTLGRMHGKN